MLHVLLQNPQVRPGPPRGKREYARHAAEVTQELAEEVLPKRLMVSPVLDEKVISQCRSVCKTHVINNNGLERPVTTCERNYAKQQSMSESRSRD